MYSIQCLKYFVCIVLVFMAACTSALIGKQVKPGDYNSFEEKAGSHSAELKDSKIQYDWKILSGNNAIKVNGTYIVSNSEWADKLDKSHKEGYITIKVAFLNQDYKIIDVGSIRMFVNSFIVKVNKYYYDFDKVFKYDPRYKYIVYYRVEIDMTYMD